MNLTEIISISGKPGLYKVKANSNKGLVVESLIDGKKLPVHSTHKVSTLSDIGIYTQDEEVPLKDVFKKIAKVENNQKTIDHKEDEQSLFGKMREILPEYDEDKVYLSDIKKVFKWYNILQVSGFIEELAKEEDNKGNGEKDEKNDFNDNDSDIKEDQHNNE